MYITNTNSRSENLVLFCQIIFYQGQNFELLTFIYSNINIKDNINMIIIDQSGPKQM